MSHVWHLVRHDLRAHRTILLAWFAVCLGHPLLAWLPWPRQAADGVALTMVVLLVCARVMLGLVAVAGIVHADSPIDDRAFWRTRPMAARTVAGAHLATVVALMVIVPMLVVFVVAVSLGVPASQWPPALTDVFVTELALASLGLVVATRTRSAASFLVGMVVVLAVVLGLPIATEALGRTLWWPLVTSSSMADPSRSMAATLVLGASVLPWCFFLAMTGPRRQPLLVVACLVVLAASTSLWFHPRPEPETSSLQRVRLAPEPQSVRVVDLPGSPGVRALVLDVVPESGLPTDAWRVTLDRGQLATPEGMRRLAGGAGVADLPRLAEPAVTAVLTVLGADEHQRLVGARARLDVIVQGYVERRPTEASGALADGATLRTDHSLLSIVHLRQGGTYGDGSLDLVIRGTEVVMEPALRSGHHHTYVLRDRTSGCEAPLSRTSFATGRRMLKAGLLPTLARPFDAEHVTLVAGQMPPCAFDARRADIDVRTFDYVHAPAASFSLDFVMPATGRAFTTGATAPRRRATPAATTPTTGDTRPGTA